MPQNNDAKLTQLEKEFTARFIEALTHDIKSSNHGTEINHQVLIATISLLKDRDACPQLSLEQIIRGAMNMALGLQNSKYGLLRSNIIGEDQLATYWKHNKRWFVGYNEGLEKARNDDDYKSIAIPVITRAAKGPLFMMSGCVPNTLSLYFEYVQQLDKSFVTPILPPSNRTFSLIEGSTAAKEFSFKIVTQEVARDYQAERPLLSVILKRLSDKIELLEKNKNHNKNSVAIAKALKNELSTAFEKYLNRELDQNISKEETTKAFIQECTMLIDNAKPQLEQEIDWSDYLSNLLKSIANAVISATNMNVRFFTPAQAPMSSEVESLEKELKDNYLSPKN
ncbi:TPA: hypothetical protein JAN72_16355 [Legionella pneumophila]|uniref:Type IV secretion protein Dot n=1 Tax=Legionella pneumophila TaxID=446 RepID=A0AAN5KU82_LEGPN|nr:hypothetical protein [Legionella pneumophila]HAT1597915.1 hypothetical protein [Legionella pneumophila]HAT1971705.1 hypothetical protein [Legionella pneumophila]HAT6955667.1 hypothetical protein [Legionella pneumophila]HAT6958290.1 hypothetical protein [Legionella pneumophila]